MKYFLYAAVALVFSGCVTAREIVTFEPDVGDHRSYQIYSTSQLKSDRGYRLLTQKSLSLLNYDITQADEVIRLDLTSDYFSISDDSSEVISSISKKSDNPKWHQLMSDGFTLAVNADNGKVVEFKAKNEKSWQALLKQGGALLVEQMRDMLPTPAVLVSLPTKVGAEVKLPEFKGQNAVLTVRKVTETTLLATIEGEQKTAQQKDDASTEVDNHDQQQMNRRFYGNMLIERETGWLISMGLVVDIKMSSATVRSIISMLPAERQVADLFVENRDYGSPLSFSANTHANASIDFTAVNRPLTKAQVLGNSVGYFSGEDGSVELNYAHNISAITAEGQLRLNDLQAFDENGKALDLKFWNFAGANSVFDRGEYRNRSEHLPLGWNEPILQLKKMREIRAQAEYVPAKVQIVTLPLSTGAPQSFNQDGASITLSPVAGEAGNYKLQTVSVDSARVKPFFDSASYGTFTFVGSSAVSKYAPDWLTAAESSILSLSLGEESFVEMLLHFDHPPKTLTFYINRLDESKALTAPLSFVTPSAYGASSALPPRSEETLFYDDQFSSVAKDSSALIDINQFKPQQQNEQSLAFSLPAEWAQTCKLSVSNAPEINHHPLIWYSEPVKNSLRYLPEKFDYVLATDDGIRRYFYGMDVTTQMRCSDTPVWEKLAYEFSDKPWLVDIAKIDGKIDRTQTAKQFLGGYRLLNQQKKPLTLAEPQSGAAIKLDDRPLKELLIDNRWLRIAGCPVTIEKRVFSGAASQQSWVTRFKPLPKGE